MKPYKLLSTGLLTLLMAGILAACAPSSSTSTSTETTTTSTSSSSNKSTSANSSAIGTVSNTLAQDEDALISATSNKFQQVEYTDSETGLTITYNVYLPENYDESKKYPTVVFIGDSSTTGDDATVSLTQRLGAGVWASDEWQSVHESIVLVPSYPEVILDDHSGYTTTDYVDLTKRFIDHASQEYAVDTNRIYGTGQSMGAMTTLILASQYTDLYAGIMIVDRQWDISTLKGLESQNMVYFAAADDENASAGMAEVKSMFDTDGISYASAEWDGNWSPDELTAATKKLTDPGENKLFVT